MSAVFNHIKSDRRGFLKGAGAVGAGLIVGFHWPEGGPAAIAAAPGEFEANAFVRIAPNSTVTIYAKHIEFGQGAFTGLATLIAEELDADWAQVRVEHAPNIPAIYKNIAFGGMGTGGSTAIANSYKQHREAGAAARALLVQAAAQKWNVPAAEVAIDKGLVSHAKTGKTSSFGDLVEIAATLPPPAGVKTKDPKDFKLIGDPKLGRKDTVAKARGETVFTIDFKLPGMVTALVARSPRFGGKVKSFDPSEAKKVKGVVDVVQIPHGVAVLANGFWAAKTGRDALKIEWDDSAAEMRGSDAIIAEYKAMLDKPGASARNEGDAENALSGAAKVIEAVYDFPYLAHAPMEPVDCVVQLSADKCEIWSGCQFPSIDLPVAASISGLKPEQVVIHTLYAGGSFGRRANYLADFTSEAVHIAKAIGGRSPVKLVWTREDDITGGLYRPIYVHKIRAGLDKDGAVIGWQHRIVGQSIIEKTAFAPMMIKNGVDATSVEGAANLPYAIPNLALDLHSPQAGITVLWWRSVGSTHTAYTTETMIDELAEAAGKDPVEFRLAMLEYKGDDEKEKTRIARHSNVLRLAAEKAAWGQPVAKGVARGVALHESFNSFVAQIVDVRLREDGTVKVERVVCAVDCGVAVNPDVIASQMEGGVGYGLGAALYDAITLKDGVVEQTNFHDYIPLRIGDMPRVEVHILPSSADPTGVGEPGVPPVAPAVANAVYKLTGKRVRSLPFINTDFGKA